MPRFFIEAPPKGRAVVRGGDARHIALALRMKKGDEIILTHGGFDFRCIIESINPDEVALVVTEETPCKTEPNIRLRLFQALPKLDKLETIIQKSVELGVYEIVPVLTKRCVSRCTAAEFEKKRDRLMKISESAAKQSGRGIVPNISPLLDFNGAVMQMRSCELALMCYENGGKRFSQVDFADKTDISLFIGSEGGFDADEAELARSAGCETMWLGERILRCETAPTVAVSLIMFLTKNL